MPVGMEPVTFSEQECAKLDELLDENLSFDFTGDDPWTDSLLDGALEVDVSIPFDAFGDEDNTNAIVFLDQTQSNPSSSDECPTGNKLDADFNFRIEDILFSPSNAEEFGPEPLGSSPAPPIGSAPGSSPGSSSQFSGVVDLEANGDQSPWISFCDSIISSSEVIPSPPPPVFETTHRSCTPQGSADSSANLEGSHSGTEVGTERRGWALHDQDSTSDLSGSDGETASGTVRETENISNPRNETSRSSEQGLQETDGLTEQPSYRNVKRKKKADDSNSKRNLYGVVFSDTTNSSLGSAGEGRGGDEDDKRKARLMRNRESAQLSRQRKKNYVDELEEKVKSMSSTIAELHNTIAFISAENINLRQQLGALCQPANSCKQPPVASLPYPWAPFPAYPGSVAAGPMAARVYAPGSQVPLVPIPRLKSQQPVAVSKTRKSSKIASPEQEKPKPAKRIKKVASVAFIGFFFFLFFLFGGIVPNANLTFRESGELLANRIDLSSGGLLLRPGGRVLTSWNEENSTVDNFTGMDLRSGESGIGQGDKGSEKMQKTDCDEKKANLGDYNDGDRLNNYVNPENISKPLVASLFVPRNDKLEKIDGNLIIHAVLAGDRALRMSGSVSRGNREAKMDSGSAKKESEKNSLAIVTERHRALAAATASGRNVDIQAHLFGGAAENQRALPSNSRKSCRENLKSAKVDGSLQQWFREGLAGPVLSSGMCTEVFQFDASPNSPSTSPNSNLVTSVSSRVVNGSGGQSRHNSSGPKMSEPRRSGPVNMPKNRRVSYAVPLPPARPPLKERNERNLTEHADRIHENREYQGKNTRPSSMVVSVLVDPRETGDEGMLSSGSLSRIFVVVLIDSVKYVTYSCVLPSKGSVPHLVTS